MRPAPWKVRPVATVWLDYVTGIGVTDSGARVTPKITGRRKRPVLVDLLDTAHNLSAERIMLTGKIPQQGLGEQHWLITETPAGAPAGTGSPVPRPGASPTTSPAASWRCAWPRSGSPPPMPPSPPTKRARPGSPPRRR